MSGPKITITAPATGSTVSSPFTASGTYASRYRELPQVSVVLKDSGGTVVATGNPGGRGRRQLVGRS